MSTLRKTGKLLSLVLVAATFAPAAFAGFSSGKFVTLGGQPAFEIKGDAYGYSAEQRAWQSQDALDNALVLSGNLSPSAVSVGRMNGAIVVLHDGFKVATADANSASLEGLSAQQLAENWANSIRSFLSDSGRASSYLATLKDPHQLEGKVAFVERRLYAPAGTTFAVVLNSPLPTPLVADTVVEGVIEKAVVMGNYAIPQGSRVAGRVVGIGPNSFGLKFNQLTTPSGTVVPISATVITEQAATVCPGPYLVSTYSIPSGMANGEPAVAGRIPARVGLGTACEATTRKLVLHQGGAAIALGQPLTVRLEETTPVAVVTLGHPM